MTRSLLLEIGLEELPAQYNSFSSRQLAKQKTLAKVKLAFESRRSICNSKELASPRQWISGRTSDKNLAILQSSKRWSMDKAAEGFVRGKV